MAEIPIWVPDSAIKLAAHPPRPGTEEVGATGSEATAGELIQTDYNIALQGLPAYDIFDRMRFSDSSIGTGLWVIKLPLLRATWTVEPPTDTPKDREIAEFVEADLMGMTIPWQEYLWQVFLMLDYGSFPFEIVWEIRDDHRAHLRKLAPRHPRTITKWLIDDHGGFNGIEQQTLRSSGFHTVTIPPEKLIVYVNQKEGSNFRGVSLLRRCYKHFTIKERLENVDAVAKEKRSMGIDVGTVSGGGGDIVARRRDLEKALMTIRTQQKNFFTEIEGQTKYRVDGLGGSGATLDPLTSVEYHDLRCLRALLVEFMAMGSEGLGSPGAHTDKTSFFIMALGGIGENVIDTTGAFLIRKMVDVNFGPQEEYPKLRHSRLETRQTKELAEAVERFVNAGVFKPGRDDEEEIRRTMDFPDLPEETEEEIEQRETEREEFRRLYATGQYDSRRDLAVHPRPPRRRRRKFTPAEERVDFAALETGLDDATEKIIRAVRSVRLRQVKKLVELGEKVIRARDSKAVEDIGVPFKADIASATTKVLVDLFLLGRREAERELRAQKSKVDLAAMPLDPLDAESARRFLGVTARSLANLYGDALRATFTREMLRQIKDGLFSGPSLEAVLSGRSERVVRTQARETVSTALNLGRQTIAEQHQDEIAHAIFSSVLDSGTCGPCNGVDGREFELNTPDFETFRPPYRECEGAGFCRCVYVFVLREEGGETA
jgi:hypothetical protein